MKLALPKVPRELTIVISVVVIILGVWAHRQFSQMDSRFFQPSSYGIQGLGLYLAGDYENARKSIAYIFRNQSRRSPTREAQPINRCCKAGLMNQRSCRSEY